MALWHLLLHKLLYISKEYYVEIEYSSLTCLSSKYYKISLRNTCIFDSIFTFLRTFL